MLKDIPPLAYPNTPSAVVGVLRVLGVFASSLHGLPRSVYRMLGLPMSPYSISEGGISQAPATLSVTPPDGAAGNSNNFTTVAHTDKRRVSFVDVTVSSGDSQGAESLSRYVNYFSTHIGLWLKYKGIVNGAK